MKQGDFTQLAKDYINRPGYSETVLSVLTKYVGAMPKGDFSIADVGAGTGKLTELLLKRELHVTAIEPNDAMRQEGESHARGAAWKNGSGEETGLENNCVNWITSASAFHWIDLEKGLTEFHRILKPGGFFTCMWNPRDLQRSELHMQIEARIYEIVPELNRVSSGSAKHMQDLSSKLLSTGHFTDCVFIEAEHEVDMTKERYLGAWRSVNDIQAQAGPERFEAIIEAIAQEIEPLDSVIVPYKTRSWTVQRVD